MYAAMGAPFAGFGTSQVIEDSVPTEGAPPSGPSSAVSPSAPAPTLPAPIQPNGGLQTGTTREVPFHLQSPQQQAQEGMVGTQPAGAPWPWLVVGVGVAAAALWYFNRRRSA